MLGRHPGQPRTQRRPVLHPPQNPDLHNRQHERQPEESLPRRGSGDDRRRAGGGLRLRKRRRLRLRQRGRPALRTATAQGDRSGGAVAAQDAEHHEGAGGGSHVFGRLDESDEFDSCFGAVRVADHAGMVRRCHN